MGITTTRELERVAAAMGLLEAAPLRFEPADDIPEDGTLCALPAPLAFGLLDHQVDTGLSLSFGVKTYEATGLMTSLIEGILSKITKQLLVEAVAEKSSLRASIS